MSDSTQEEAHTGPIKTPKQLLLAVLFAFVVPIFAIIALVFYVSSESKPAGSMQSDRYALGGMTAQDMDKAVAERIRKVGMVEIRDANRPLKSGEEVFKAQCAACHTTGAAGAPKLGDAAAWQARIATGLESLVASALKGKGAMPAQGGGDFDDVEIARSVAYMANAAGAKFSEPQPRAQAAAAATPATASAAAPVASNSASGTSVAPASASNPSAAPAAAAAVPTAAGEALFKQACAVCHIAGVANAPKLGDKAAWAPRIKNGVPALVQAAINGKGAMPPRGGSSATDAEIRAMVEYMVQAAK